MTEAPGIQHAMPGKKNFHGRSKSLEFDDHWNEILPPNNQAQWGMKQQVRCFTSFAIGVSLYDHDLFKILTHWDGMRSFLYRQCEHILQH